MARRPVVRAALAALAVAALLGVAAAGAGSGAGFDRDRGDRSALSLDWSVLADYVLLSVIVLLVAAELALLVLAVREHPELLVRQPKRRSRGGLVLLVLALVLVVRFQDDFSRWYREHFGDQPGQPAAPALATDPGRGDGSPLRPADGLGVLLTVLAGAALVGVVGGAGYVSWRRRRAAAPDGLREALTAELDASLEEIEQIEDPRLAVLACYDRLGRVLADHGLVPSPADTPGELVARVLRAHDVAGPSAERLARLFERARFSDHPVNEAMRQEAIARLADVRDQLAARRSSDEAVPA